MAQRFAIIAAFLFFLTAASSFAQFNNNCIPWTCEYPPDGCSYCQVTQLNGNSYCSQTGIFPDGSGCWLGGFCDTGLGGCSDADSCSGVLYRDFWIRLTPPRSLRDEWQLVDVSVKRKAIHRSGRS
jgi:hypothetical protein